jgi:hypothetical protein
MPLILLIVVLLLLFGGGGGRYGYLRWRTRQTTGVPMPQDCAEIGESHQENRNK